MVFKPSFSATDTSFLSAQTKPDLAPLSRGQLQAGGVKRSQIPFQDKNYAFLYMCIIYLENQKVLYGIVKNLDNAALRSSLDIVFSCFFLLNAETVSVMEMVVIMIALSSSAKILSIVSVPFSEWYRLTTALVSRK